MRFSRPKPTRDSEANLIPLINIVFLLLIFFMLAGRLAPTELMALEPPRSDSLRSAQVTTLVVLVDQSGQIRLEGETLDKETLAERIALHLADGPQSVQIKADAGLDAMQLLDLLEQLRAAGAEELDLLTLARGG
jgi:biopolymer transport protein ExbD